MALSCGVDATDTIIQQTILIYLYSIQTWSPYPKIFVGQVKLVSPLGEHSQEKELEALGLTRVEGGRQEKKEEAKRRTRRTR